jgi:tRNA pseudouridine38-40 synthase
MKVALLIEYDGTDFSGWQVQDNGRSVQGELERACQQLFGERIPVHGAGRTDAGVHGRGMVAHVELPDTMTLHKLVMALNATTPKDIAVRDTRLVPEDFHARHSASSRTYRYTIKQERTALDRNFVWAIHRKVDQETIERITTLLPGEHDFTSFSKRTNDVDHYRCIVQHASWDFHGTTFALTIRANRFVRGMVRALVGAIVQTGQGMLSEAQFKTLLHSPRELARAKYLAPPHGLILEAVEYPEHYGLWPLGWQANQS